METALQRARRALIERNRIGGNDLPAVSEPASQAPQPDDINDGNDQRAIPGAPKPSPRMQIDEFAQSRRTVRIYSEVLSCEVLLAADNASPEAIERAGCPVYWAREFKQLLGLEPDTVRLLHEVRLRFSGELID